MMEKNQFSTSSRKSDFLWSKKNKQKQTAGMDACWDETNAQKSAEPLSPAGFHSLRCYACVFSTCSARNRSKDKNKFSTFHWAAASAIHILEDRSTPEKSTLNSTTAVSPREIFHPPAQWPATPGKKFPSRISSRTHLVKIPWKGLGRSSWNLSVIFKEISLVILLLV